MPKFKPYLWILRSWAYGRLILWLRIKRRCVSSALSLFFFFMHVCLLPWLWLARHTVKVSVGCCQHGRPHSEETSLEPKVLMCRSSSIENNADSLIQSFPSRPKESVHFVFYFNFFPLSTPFLKFITIHT